MGLFKRFNPILYIGRGIGQVMFQRNAFSGYLMLVGIACSSGEAALLALAGTIVSTLTAYYSGYSKRGIQEGLYGFNGALVGIVAGMFFQAWWVKVLFMLIGAAVSTWIYEGMSRLRWFLSPLTAPFVLTGWLLLLTGLFFLPNQVASSPDPTIFGFSLFDAYSFGFGQVFLQGGSVWTGIFIFLAILLNSWVSAGFALMGASVPILITYWANPFGDYNVLNLGLASYNGVLAAMALAEKRLMAILFGLVASCVATLLWTAGMRLDLGPQLTAPFILGAWAVMTLRHYTEIEEDYY